MFTAALFTITNPQKQPKCLLVDIWGHVGESAGKESTSNAWDLGSIPGLGRSPGEGNGNPLQYSFLENPHGQRSLAGNSPWGYKESNTTEWLSSVCVCTHTHKHNGIPFRHKKEDIMVFVVMWMDLEIIILSNLYRERYISWAYLTEIYPQTQKTNL